jgi:hypothetical protein
VLVETEIRQEANSEHHHNSYLSLWKHWVCLCCSSCCMGTYIWQDKRPYLMLGNCCMLARVTNFSVDSWRNTTQSVPISKGFCPCSVLHLAEICILQGAVNIKLQNVWAHFRMVASGAFKSCHFRISLCSD